MEEEDTQDHDESTEERNEDVIQIQESGNFERDRVFFEFYRAYGDYP